MIDEIRLRDDLSRLLTAIEANIRRRCEEDPAVNHPLEERYRRSLFRSVSLKCTLIVPMLPARLHAAEHFAPIKRLRQHVPRT